MVARKNVGRRGGNSSKATKTGPFLRVVGTVAALSLLVFSAWKLAESPLFALTEVRVQGNAALKSQQVELLAGLKRGENLLKLRSSKVAEGVRRSPWVASVQVHKELPGRLVIKISERVPTAIIFSGSRYHLVDGGGTVLWADIRPSGYKLPLVVSLPVAPQAPGSRFDSHEVREVLSIVAGLDPALRSQLTYISAPKVDQTTLHLTSGVAVLYGEAEELREKNFAAREIIKDAGQRREKLRQIDVRVPTLSTSELMTPPATISVGRTTATAAAD